MLWSSEWRRGQGRKGRRSGGRRRLRSNYMECLSSSRELSDYLNGRGTEQERREVHRHLSSCARCADQAEERVRAAVLRLPVRTPDQALKTRLQVLASKESLRRRKRLSIAHAWKNWRENFQLSFKNL